MPHRSRLRSVMGSQEFLEILFFLFIAAITFFLENFFEWGLGRALFFGIVGTVLLFGIFLWIFFGSSESKKEG